MPRTLTALALLCALASPAMAGRHRSHRAECVPVMIEFIQVNICARPRRR